MENGYLSGLLRPPPIPSSSVPLLPPPAWGSRGGGGGNGGLMPHHPHPSSLHSPHPFGSSHPSISSSSSGAPRIPGRPPTHPPFDHHRNSYYDREQQSSESSYPKPPLPHHPSSFLYPPPHPPPTSQTGGLSAQPSSNIHSTAFGGAGFGFLGPPNLSHHQHPRDGGSNSSSSSSSNSGIRCAGVGLSLSSSASASTSSSFHSVCPPPSSSVDNNSFTQALLNLSKVSPLRNSVASSTCVTSVSSSQVFKRESGSAFSTPSKTNLSSPTPVTSATFDEEVLVDDFDGQCCRTYPLNHSRIVKWREERKKTVKVKEINGSNSSANSSGKSSSSEANSVSSSSSSNSTSTSSTNNVPLASNSNSAIPVGIAIGRQRQQLYEKPPSSSNEAASSKRNDHPSLIPRSVNGPPHPGHLDPASGLRPSLLHPSLGIPPPWGSSNPSLPHPWPLDRYPDSGLPFSPHPSWPHAPHMGPIPMGYQLAKDPLTGQILLIPTDGAGPPRPNPLWPNSSLSSFPPAAAAAPASPYHHHHHQLYLQQHFHYMRQQGHQQQHLSPPVQHQQQHPPPHKLRSVPETINLGSSSEDEENETNSDKVVKSTTSDQKEDNDESIGDKEETTSSKEKSLFDLEKVSEESASIIISPTESKEDLSKSEPSSLPLQDHSKDVVLKKEKEDENAISSPVFDPNIKIKSEIIEEDESLMDIKVDDYQSVDESVVEALLSLGSDLLFDGFDALITALEESIPSFDEETGFELLCRAVKNDSISYGFPTFFDDAYHLDVNLLCSVTVEDYTSFLNYVDPMTSLRSKYNLHAYSNPEKSTEFISNRIKKAETLKYENGEVVGKYEGIKSLAAVIKTIKNTEIMSQLEVELRGALVQIQSSYRDKQKELARLKALSPKKRRRGNCSSHNKRPPGRPKKQKISKKTRPSSKQAQQQLKIQSPSRQKDSFSDNDADEEYEEEDEEEEEDLSPPILEPATASSNQEASLVCPSNSSVTSISSTLLKPPKLTASNQVTNLSTIKARFMKGKENPFANLMKLATTPSSSKPGSTKSGDSEYEEEDTIKEELHQDEDHKSLLDEEAPSTEDEVHSISSTSSYHKCNEDISCNSTFSNNIKKRKSDNPQKHSASTETLVTKKPKNLFMMNRLNYPSSFSEDKEDEYEYEFDEEDVEEDEEDEEEVRETVQDTTKKITFAGPSHFTQKDPKKDKPSNNNGHKTTKMTLDKNPIPSSSEANPSDTELRSAKLTAEDLKDGLRLLMLNDGRFWPARLNSTRLPDVYGVVMEKQRGNRPQILPRDDILQECIMEVKPEKKEQIPPGTRVCVVWSSAYNCLFPGTVENNDDSLIQVELDDGDTRDVVISNVRMLPYNYSHVFHDPDPIATLRKRRQSSDSVEGKESKSITNAVVSTPSKSESELAPKTTPFSPEAKPKKKHKHSRRHHHRRHRCKRRHHHKKHKPLRVKLDGTFNNTTTYSIRSPPVFSNNRVSGGNNVDSRIPASSHLGSVQKSEAESESEEDDESQDEEEKYEESEDDGDSSSDNDEDPSSSSQSQRNFFKEKSPPSSKFNPVTGRPLWSWGDDGYRRPGSKGKAKKLFHRSITRCENEVLNVGDCAVFLSLARVDRPYIGRIETFWETWNSGHMMVKVKWFYHPEEIETNGKSVDLKIPGGLFQSPHMDENDVQTISHKCSVIPFKDFSSSNARSSSTISDKRKKNSTHNTYYLAGNYEPGTFAVQCLPGVLK